MNTEEPGEDAGLDIDDVDATVVVPRSGGGRRAARAAEADRAADDTDDDDIDDTVIVDREEGAPVASAGSDTAGPPADQDDTVVVQGSLRPPTADRRRGLQRTAGAAVLIPVQLPSGVRESPRASRGQGTGHRERYDPRPVPAPPRAMPSLGPGVDASRLEAPAMPSVRRASRRAGVLTIVALIGAVVLSVAGLTWVVQSLSAG